MNRGSLYKNMGQHEKEALKDYNRAIWLEPNYPLTYNKRGSLYETLGEQKKALNDYNYAIQLEPNFAIAIKNRDALLEQMKLKL